MTALTKAPLFIFPTFFVVWLLQVVTRDGYDVRRHPMSLLALGEGGWVQIANFAAAGVAALLLAAALRRQRPVATWAPRLVATFGAGLIIAGLFVTDAGAGFPPGAPEGAPAHLSWRGAVHELGFIVAQLAWLAAAAALARSFSAANDRTHAVLCLVALAAAVVVAAWPHAESLAPRLVLVTAIELGLLTAVARRLSPAPAPRPSAVSTTEP
ncbi:MAG: DUF998 domain-containing protein [Myxococcaceae bacterium]|nr:DUF998 domain-containing protein [Myxococcaceae bacterium]